MQLAFQSYGSAGDPVIILHGLFGSRENWHCICLRLAEEHFRVLAVDQRNHGESPHSPEMDYLPMAQDVTDLVRSLDLAPAHLLGHSMGAKTAMQLALLYPEQVQSLISVDMAPRAYRPRHEKILEGLLSLELASFQSRRQIEQALEPWVPDLATRRFLLKNLRRSPKGAFEWRIGLHEISNNYARLGESVEGGRPYAGPALFIRGGQSDYLVEADLEDIRPKFPNARLEVVPGAGHLMHVEKPENFLALVLRFLRANPRP